MSHFYAGIHGSRGPATRCGTKGSGHSAYVQGWQGGIRAEVYYDKEKDEDRFALYLTGGGGSNHEVLLLTGVLDISKAMDGSAGFVLDSNIVDQYILAKAKEVMTDGS